jgi:hypothetical protein
LPLIKRIYTNYFFGGFEQLLKFIDSENISKFVFATNDNITKKTCYVLRNVTGSVSVQSLKKANCLFFIPDRSGILFFPIFFGRKDIADGGKMV